MKKAIILFLVFFIIDIFLFEIFGSFNYGKDFATFFLPAIFIEIAFYGSLIIYEVSKKGEGN